MLKQAYQQGFQTALTKYAAGLPPFMLRQLLPGAAVGAAGGLAQHVLSDDPNKDLVSSLGRGALVGTAGGAALQGLGRGAAKLSPEIEAMLAKGVQGGKNLPGRAGDAMSYLFPHQVPAGGGLPA